MARQGRSILIGVGLTLAVLAVGAAVYVYSGAYNVAATEDHTAIGRWLLNTMAERSIEVRADEAPARPPTDAAMVQHGFEHYREMCVVCHGAPGVERGEFGQGITPQPPDLAEEAAEFEADELFWVTKHGIKLAGMPAFGPTHSDAEIWSIVAFLEQLVRMTPEQYGQWEASIGDGSDSAENHGGAGAEPHAH